MKTSFTSLAGAKLWPVETLNEASGRPATQRVADCILPVKEFNSARCVHYRLYYVTWRDYLVMKAMLDHSARRDLREALRRRAVLHSRDGFEQVACAIAFNGIILCREMPIDEVVIRQLSSARHERRSEDASLTTSESKDITGWPT